MDTAPYLRAHGRIRAAFWSIQTELGAGADAERLYKGVVFMREDVARHLAFEDERLYPAFAASGDPELVSLGGRFWGDMLDVTEAWRRFTDHWNSPTAIAAAPAHFAADVASLSRLVEQRMAHEELELYTAAQHLPDGK